MARLHVTQTTCVEESSSRSLNTVSTIQMSGYDLGGIRKGLLSRRLPRAHPVLAS
jgi:hypothetical protein